jgi:hypothetical protein
MTYLIVTPYLTGLHLTLALHQPGCNKLGWKIGSKEWAAYLFESVENGKITHDKAESMSRAAVEPVSSKPEDEEPFSPPRTAIQNALSPPSGRIKGARRLKNNTRALGVLLEAELLGQVLIQATIVYTILYGFTDASGSGLGSTIMLNGGIRYRIGTWGPDKDETSNYREFENIVNALREEAKAGKLWDTLIFFCTDNSTVESAIVKGNSSSEKIFELTLEV